MVVLLEIESDKDTTNKETDDTIIYQRIRELTRAADQDWYQYKPVFERTAEVLSSGEFYPDIHKLHPSSGDDCINNLNSDDESMVKNAFRSVFLTEYREKERRRINNSFLQVSVEERVFVSGEWLNYFKRLIHSRSNGAMRLAARRVDTDTVLTYKKEAYFTMIIEAENEYVAICLSPEWAKPFFEYETPARNNSQPKQEQAKGTTDWCARAKYDGTNTKTRWRCAVM